MMRLIAVGDIHGRLEQLTNLLQEIAPSTNDRVVFLGDYIDRGPDSKGVIDFLIRFREKFQETVFLQGNHERLMLDALTEAGIDTGVPLLSSVSGLWDRETVWAASIEGMNRMLWMRNHGDKTLQSYGCDLTEIPNEHISFLASTVLWHKYDNFLFVHASVGTKQPIEKQDPYGLLWDRDGFWMYNAKWNLRVVHGHTPVLRPTISKKTISLDTGAGDGGPLTACDVLAERIWQA